MNIDHNHTYIMIPGKWQAKGIYFDENYGSLPVHGETEILHNSDGWILDGYMELELEETVRFYNKYTITPFKKDADFTSWISENPVLGTLVGKFMIAGNLLLSSWQSKDNEYSGTECLIRLDSKKYKNHGFAFHDDQKLSSWEVELMLTSL